MLARLAKRLRDQPKDIEGWKLLGRSLSAVGQYNQAADAFRKAVDLSENDAGLLVTLGDVLTKGAGGTITPEALIIFTKARELAPENLPVQYFLGLADLQAGRLKNAFDAWLGLYGKFPAGSENQQALAEQIRRLAQRLGVDPEEHLASKLQSTPPSAATLPRPVMKPGPGPDRAAMAEAAKMSASEREEFIQSMVQRLANRLEDEPDDFDGWIRLGRAYSVLRRNAEAARAYGRAADLRPTDPGPLEAQIAILIGSMTQGKAVPEATLGMLRKLEALQPDNRRALWFLGMADATAGRRSEAIVRWERLYGLLPSESRERARIKIAIERLKKGT